MTFFERRLSMVIVTTFTIGLLVGIFIPVSKPASLEKIMSTVSDCNPGSMVRVSTRSGLFGGTVETSCTWVKKSKPTKGAKL